MIVHNQEILNHIKNGNIDDAIDTLITLLYNNSELHEEYNTALSIKSRWELLKREKHRGVLLRSEYTLEQSKLIDTLQEITALLPHKIKTTSTGKKSKLNIRVLYFAVFVFIIFIIINQIFKINKDSISPPSTAIDSSEIKITNKTIKFDSILVEDIQTQTFIGKVKKNNDNEGVSWILKRIRSSEISFSDGHMVGSCKLDNFIKKIKFVWAIEWNSDKERELRDSEGAKYERGKVYFPLIKFTLRNKGTEKITIYGFKSEIVCEETGISAQGSEVLAPLNEEYRLYPGKDLIFNNPILLDKDGICSLQFSPTFEESDQLSFTMPDYILFKLYVIANNGEKTKYFFVGSYLTPQAVIDY